MTNFLWIQWYFLTRNSQFHEFSVKSMIFFFWFPLFFSTANLTNFLWKRLIFILKLVSRIFCKFNAFFPYVLHVRKGLFRFGILVQYSRTHFIVVRSKVHTTSGEGFLAIPYFMICGHICRPHIDVYQSVLLLLNTSIFKMEAKTYTSLHPYA